MAKTVDPKEFRAPLTHAPLESGSSASWSDSNGNSYPLLSGMPVLLPDAKLALADLKIRARALLSHYERNVDDLKALLKPSNASAAPSKLTKARLEKTRETQIHHLEFLRDLFEPLKLNRAQATPEPDFGYRLPPGQGLQGYFPNLVRDWCGSRTADGSTLSQTTGSPPDENAAQWSLIKRELGSLTPTKMLVAGSGGGRLAYDLHQNFSAGETFACDLNLVLTLAAKRISAGETLRVAEFPTAPKNASAAAGVVRSLSAPKPAREGLHHVLADVYYLPFADESFDLVVTPWLVDIVPHRLEFLLSEINRVLKPGGVWVNSGSFNFRFANWADSLSIEEAMEQIEHFGFKQSGFKQDLIPYLRSDLDAHERSEWVTTFRAEKTGPSPSPQRLPLRPSWLLDPQNAVPTRSQLPQIFATLESQAFVLSLIDGKRTLVEIASLVSQRYGLSGEDALDAVVSYLSRLEDEAVFRSNVQA